MYSTPREWVDSEEGQLVIDAVPRLENLLHEVLDQWWDLSLHFILGFHSHSVTIDMEMSHGKPVCLWGWVDSKSCGDLRVALEDRNFLYSAARSLAIEEPRTDPEAQMEIHRKVRSILYHLQEGES